MPVELHGDVDIENSSRQAQNAMELKLNKEPLRIENVGADKGADRVRSTHYFNT